MIVVVRILRILLRLAVYPWIVLVCWLDFVSSGARGTMRQRVDWLHRVAVRHAKWLGLRVRVHGQIPQAGLIVSNHLGYLDIVGLSAAGAFAFVSKREVAGWPLFGAYAEQGATIFVNREQRGAVAGVADLMRAHLEAGVPIVLFPEGTSTGGDRVLPFRSSLFDPVVKLACPLTACGLRYELEGGRVIDDVAYWGDMALLPHMLKLLGHTGLRLEIYFGPSSPRTADRKALARQLHEEVSTLAGLAPVPAAS